NAKATLFTDDNGESALGYVSSIQLWNIALNSGQIRSLGGATSNGLPQVLPIVPTFIESRTPAANAVNVAPLPTVTINLNSGDSTVPTSSIHLLVDGSEIPAEITPNT